MLLVGNHYVALYYGDVEVPIQPQMMEEASLTLDVSRLLPTFKFVLKDATGILAEILPFDRNMSRMRLEFARSKSVNDLNIFRLAVKRRKPDFDKSYEVEGVLDVNDLLTSVKTRAMVGNIKDNLTVMASEELGIKDVEIGASLDYDKTILQPTWTNGKLLNYLSSHLVGANGELCYYCFIKNVRGKQVLVIKSLNEILSTNPKYKFMIGPQPYEDYYPVSEYKIYDNSGLISDFGAQRQDFGYFDYETGQYIVDSVDIDDCPSVAGNVLVDFDNDSSGSFVTGLGRSNDYTADFHDRCGGNYFRGVNNFINMWISTWGLENVSPGDIVRVMFSESMIRGKLFMYQHSGNWMVQRVVHTLGLSYMTHLLLTRSGVETDIDTTLKGAQNLKRS
jgi:hypothetical protein